MSLLEIRLPSGKVLRLEVDAPIPLAAESGTIPASVSPATAITEGSDLVSALTGVLDLVALFEQAAGALPEGARELRLSFGLKPCMKTGGLVVCKTPAEGAFFVEASWPARDFIGA